MNKCFFIGRLVNDPEISSYEKKWRKSGSC